MPLSNAQTLRLLLTRPRHQLASWRCGRREIIAGVWYWQPVTSSWTWRRVLVGFIYNVPCVIVGKKLALVKYKSMYPSLQELHLRRVFPTTHQIDVCIRWDRHCRPRAGSASSKTICFVPVRSAVALISLRSRESVVIRVEQGNTTC